MTVSKPCNLLIDHAYLITMDPQRTMVVDGALVVVDGRVAAVGPRNEIVSSWTASATIDAGGAPVHPGFIETHTHITIHTTRGVFPDTLSWDEAVAFYADFWNEVTPEEEYIGARLACLELARNGGTGFLEAGTVLDPDAAARAASEVGIRAWLADPFLWDIGGFTADSPTVHRAPPTTARSLEALGGQLARNSNPDALVQGHVSLIGMGSASDELTLAAKAAARDHGVILNQHQSFAPPDVADDDRRLGRHPLVHLAELGVLDDATTLAHMNIIRDDEVDPVVDSGLSISWCPIASMLMGAGGTVRGRHCELHHAGVNISLGSDSANWAGRFDPGSVALVALLTARDKTQSRTALDSYDVLRMGTTCGARAVGAKDQLGTLEEGRRADFVVRRLDSPEAQPYAPPYTDPVQSVVLAGRESTIDTVVVAGEIVVQDGRSTRVDEAEVYAQAREAAVSLARRMGVAPVVGSGAG